MYKHLIRDSPCPKDTLISNICLSFKKLVIIFCLLSSLQTILPHESKEENFHAVYKIDTFQHFKTHQWYPEVHRNASISILTQEQSILFKTLTTAQLHTPKEGNIYNIQNIPIWKHTRLLSLDPEVWSKTWVLTITAQWMTSLLLS